MSHSQRDTPVLAQLCTLLVDDVYGELAARVHSVLARHGRQTLAGISRASYLSVRQIKYGLVILLQQHLVFHAGADDTVTYYEIDWRNSYALIRFGRVTKLAQDRFGKKAANVVSNLLSLGHTRVSDLVDAYFPKHPDSDDESDDGIVNGVGLRRKQVNGTHTNGIAPKTNGHANGLPVELDDAKPDTAPVVNGCDDLKSPPLKSKTSGAVQNVTAQEPEHLIEQDDGSISSEAELYEIVHRLRKCGWVMIATDTQYLSPGDMHQLQQQRAIDQVNKGEPPTGTKAKDAVNRETINCKRIERDSWLSVSEPSRKRKASPFANGGSNKRQKVNGANGWAPVSLSPEENVVIHVNPDKIAVAMRTEQLVQLVERRLGATTACVYRTMLRMIENHTPRCFDEWEDPPFLPNGEKAPPPDIEFEFLVTAHDVAKNLGQDVDICEGLDPNAVVHVTKKGHVRSLNILSQPVDCSTLGLDERTRLVDKHIQLLSNDPLHFVTWHSRSQWRIEFDELAKQMIQSEIEKTIASRNPKFGVKLIRTLRKKGKLDERAICNTMMMPPTEIRGVVNDLTVQGFIQTQELPKVDRREAKLSLHLVWYDRQRAREKLLHDTYKGMVRILQRIAFERERVQPLLTKAERSDVVGNEEKWLSKGELDALKKWKSVQEKLLMQLFREDDLVATLRDFHGPLVSV